MVETSQGICTQPNGAQYVDAEVLLHMLKTKHGNHEDGNFRWISCLANCIESTATGWAYEYYAQVLADTSYRFAIESAADDMKKQARDGSVDSTSLFDMAMDKIVDTGRLEGNSSSISFMDDVIKNELIPSMEAIASGEGDSEHARTYTGFHAIDKIMAGVVPGSLNIIAGRPGSGKTSL